MITGEDIYDVLAAIVPLYVAMILAYGSVRWWKVFTPEQCSGINRFVAVFAVPLLSFHFISHNNPYEMDYRFIAADSLQKVVILVALFIWHVFGKNGSLEWAITLFSLSTLPNTLVMGIPLLKAMYGDFSGNLMVQIVVLQSVIWYTLMLFMFEYRGAKLLITEQFPENAGSITSFKVESDVMSLNGREPLETSAEVGDDGKLHVRVRKSTPSSLVSSYNKSLALNSRTSVTPRASNLTGVEIYSVQSSREPTPRGSSFNQTDFYAMFSSKMPSPKHVYSNSVQGGGADAHMSMQSSKEPTPRSSNFEEEMTKLGKKKGRGSMSGELLNHGTLTSSYPPPNPMFSGSGSGGKWKEGSGSSGGSGGKWREGSGGSGGGKWKEGSGGSGGGGKWKQGSGGSGGGGGGGAIPSKELHMFVWSSSVSPASEGNLRHAVNRAASTDFAVVDSSKAVLQQEIAASRGTHDFNETASPTRKVVEDGEMEIEDGMKFPSNSSPFLIQKQVDIEGGGGTKTLGGGGHMPPASVMTRLILIMVWRKLIRNPNTYSSVIGLIWSLVTFRFNIQMPTIVSGSITILSNAGLGMAMFSLGLFMALQPKMIACGKRVATFSMAVRFLTGPAVIAATSIAVGLRGVLLHVAIVQAALPQGIVPFVFAKEYNVHPDILSTAVIFGMLIALPITVLYYILLGL